MGDEPQDSKVTTESSQAVLKAVAGRLAKIDAGEMSTIQYVGHDGTESQAVNYTGQVAAVPGAVSPTAPTPTAPRSRPPSAPRARPQPAPRSGPPVAPRTQSQSQPQAAPASAPEADERIDLRPAPPTQQAARSTESVPSTTEPVRGSWWSRLLHKLGIR